MKVRSGENILVIILSLFFSIYGSNTNSVKLEIFSSYTVYYAGDRVNLNLKVTNITDSVITLPYSPYFQQFVNTYAVCERDTIRIEHPIYSMGHGRSPTNELEPGGFLEYPLLNKKILLENGNHGDHFFEKTGIYIIFCIYSNIRSNELILNIIHREPE